MSFASGALSYSENSVEAGWQRDIEVKDTIGYYKMACLEAFNMTIPGIPVIYYGDEYGMSGGGDPDNRRMMKFDSLTRQEQALKETTSRLAKLRGSSLPLIYGDFKTLKVTDKNLAFMRSYFDKAVFVVFNKDRSPRKIDFDVPERYQGAELKANFGKNFTFEKGKLSVTLPGNSFEIFSN
jgi:glycosidase